MWVLLAVLLLATPALAQVPQPGAPEDPETLFASKLGDADVDLFIDGSWRASLTAGFGFAWLPEVGFTYPYEYPDFPGGIVFDQLPDMTISLWLMKRYFMEGVFTEGYELNSYVVGYQGREGEFVQSVRAGTKDVSIGRFPYMDFPGSSRTSPGVSAVFQTPNTKHELLFRYDPSLPAKKTYLGKSELVEVRIDPRSYVRGRYFVLPDAGIDSLDVYLEDANGGIFGSDGRRYRKASAFDVAFSLTDGTMTLAAPSAGRVLVYYTKGGLSVGAVGLGRNSLVDYTPDPPDYNVGPILIDPPNTQDFDFATAASYMANASVSAPVSLDLVTADGKACLLLFDPGEFAPFELAAYYEGSAVGVSSTTAEIVNKGGTTRASFSPALSVKIEGAMMRVLPATAGIRDMFARYPFGSRAPLLYGPDRGKTDDADFEILLRSYTPVTAYTLPDDVIPGSVEVRRNGQSEPSFTVDYDTRVVIFPFEPAATDYIEIFYRTYSGRGLGGDILFGTGHTIGLAEDLVLKLATGLRWNVLKGSYSVEPGDHPGQLATSAELAWKRENLDIKVDGVVAYTNPDTTGLLRLLGMEAGDSPIPIGKNTIMPSSVPEGGFPDPVFPQPTRANRGILVFKNFEKTGQFGEVSLQDYTWDPPGGQVFPYEDGSKPGPYIAGSGTSSVEDPVMVLDFQLGTNEWVGGQIQLPRTGILDLSSATTLRFKYRLVSVSAPVDLYVQAGAVSEDLDDDGRLDEEVSPLSRGFTFDDEGIRLLVGNGQDGTGNGIRDTEDQNRNGILETENSDLVFSDLDVNRTGAVGSGDWRTVERVLTLDERHRLTDLRAVRFVARSTGSASTGRILIGDVAFQGSPFATSAESGGLVRVREIAEPGGAGALRHRYPEVMDIFRPDGNNRIAEVVWEALGTPWPAGDWTISRYTTAVPPGRYHRVNLFLRAESVAGGDALLEIALTDAEGRGVKQRITAGPTGQLRDNGGWRRLSIDLGRRNSTLDGATIPEPTIDRNHAQLVRFSIRQVGGTSTAGTIFIDELYFSDSADAVGGAGSLSANLFFPGTLLSAGGLPLAANLTLRENVNFRTAGYSRAEDRPPELSYANQSAISVDLVNFFRTEASFGAVSAGESVEFSGGHDLRFPITGSPLTFREFFRRDYRESLPSMDKGLGVALALPEVGTANADWTTMLVDERITQRWTLKAGRTTEGWTAGASVNLEQRTREYLLDTYPYGLSWARTYALILPYQFGTDEERSGNYQAEAAIEPDPIGFRGKVDFAWRNSASIDGLRTDTARIESALPFVVDPASDLRAELYYRRDLSSTQGAEHAGEFAKDSDLLFGSLGRQRYFHSGPPLAEIFVPWWWTAFETESRHLEKATYQPEIGLSTSRGIGSRPLDLLVPNRVDFSIRRSLVRDGDALSSARIWTARLTHLAVNLFGRAGTTPILPFYLSDEFQFVNSLAVTDRENTGERLVSLTTQQSIRFYGPADEELNLNSTVRYDSEPEPVVQAEGGIQYIWRVPGAPHFGVELLKTAVERGAYVRHAQQLLWTWISNSGDTGLTGAHTTSIEFPERGSIGAEIKIGIKAGPESEVTAVGVLAGIYAHLRF